MVFLKEFFKKVDFEKKKKTADDKTPKGQKVKGGFNSGKELTHISIASFLLDIGKQCIPRSDATERGVCSGSPLFAYRMFYLKGELTTVPTHGFSLKFVYYEGHPINRENFLIMQEFLPLEHGKCNH